MEERIR